MSSKKTIQVNPELFKLGRGNKTKKNMDSNKKELFTPIITPNHLKNKLLKRIKEHKNNELRTANERPTSNNGQPTSEAYTDEFNGAINYLSGLKNKQKQLRHLNNKTLKQRPTIATFGPSKATFGPSKATFGPSKATFGPSEATFGPSKATFGPSKATFGPSDPSEATFGPTDPSMIQFQSQQSDFYPQISLELPPELEESKICLKRNDDVPYGCLKNGNKKTYREWKGLLEQEVQPPFPIRAPTPPKKNTGFQLNNANNNANNMIKYKLSPQMPQMPQKPKEEKLVSLPSIDDLERMTSSFIPADVEQIVKEQDTATAPDKKYFKQTTKRKYTLGKSEKMRRVGVLIKDKQTRKNIINTQKELKKTSLTDVKKYLRQHGIIKIGSTCPQDILRKTFETAVLTGEVTNTNKETILHNFMNGTDE